MTVRILPPTPTPDYPRILDALQDAVVELEVWRQNARTTEERSALRRIASALGAAQQEILEGAGPVPISRDEAQQSLIA